MSSSSTFRIFFSENKIIKCIYKPIYREINRYAPQYCRSGNIFYNPIAQNIKITLFTVLHAQNGVPRQQDVQICLTPWHHLQCNLGRGYIWLHLLVPFGQTSRNGRLEIITCHWYIFLPRGYYVANTCITRDHTVPQKFPNKLCQQNISDGHTSLSQNYQNV